MGVERSSLAPRPRFIQPMPQSVRNMHLAVMQNDVPRLRVLLSSVRALPQITMECRKWICRHSIIIYSVDVNHPWMNSGGPKDGTTALSEAVSLNHIEAARALIEAGARISDIDKHGWAILQKAAYHGRDMIVKMLINAGVNPKDTDKENNTPLHICAKNGFVHNNPKCILTLLQCGAGPNIRNKKGAIALHYVATWGMSEMVSILIEWKSDLDCIDNDYLTPFHVAVAPIISQQRKKPAILMREMFVRQLPAINILLKAGCDSLGFASWVAEQKALRAVTDDPEFMQWFSQHYPESLKHQCRVYIQTRLCFTSVRHNYCVRKVKKFDIPKTLKEYLCRRIIAL